MTLAPLGVMAPLREDVSYILLAERRAEPRYLGKASPTLRGPKSLAIARDTYRSASSRRAFESARGRRKRRANGARARAQAKACGYGERDRPRVGATESS